MSHVTWPRSDVLGIETFYFSKTLPVDGRTDFAEF